MWEEWLAEQAADRDRAGLRRTLHPHGADDHAADLAGNDYLGLCHDPTVTAAAAAAAIEWGAGSGASRLVSGSLALHATLEAELAAYLGQPAGLVFSTGYHANLSVVSALVDDQSLVVSDAHIHASLIDAVRLSKARVRVVPHNDVDAVRRALDDHAGTGGRAMVLCESVYSVLGDRAPLTDLAAACAETGALLVVDEAHSLGVHGPGLVAAAGLAGRADIAVTATLSKALGSQGGAVLGSAAIIDHLINRARPFIFDTGLSPAATAGAMAALGLVRERPELAERIRTRMLDLAATLGVDPASGAVLSVPMPSAQAAQMAQAAAAENGVRIGCFRPPSVPDGVSRLRITINAGLAEEDWSHATAVLVAVVKEHR